MVWIHSHDLRLKGAHEPAGHPRFTLAGLAVDRVLANHSLSSTASQGRSNITKRLGDGTAGLVLGTRRGTAVGPKVNLVGRSLIWLRWSGPWMQRLGE